MMGMCRVTISHGDRLAGQARCTSVPVTYFPYYFPPATDCPPQEAEQSVVRPGIAKDQTKLPGE